MATVDANVAPTQPGAATPAAQKGSWLKRIGQFIGKIIGVVAKDAKPIADIAKPVAEALLPQFTPEIEAAYGLVVKIAKQSIVAEATAAAIGQASGTGAQKLQTVLGSVGPDIDAWISNNFPGAATLSSTTKAGLVSAVVAILNEIEGHPVVPVQ